MSIMASTTPIRETRVYNWTCRRCGYEFDNAKPNSTMTCADCRLVESTSSKNGQATRALKKQPEGLERPCRAWMRDFDDLDHPIHPDGTLVAPGGRLCGHSDCVEPTHIVSPDE